MTRLGDTIANVVHNMNPTMICMCEVGEATKPLTEEQMQQVSCQSMHAWKGAATEHLELRSMSGRSTIYDDWTLVFLSKITLAATGNPNIQTIGS